MCHTESGIRIMVSYEVWYSECVIRIVVYGVCRTKCGLRSVSYGLWYTECVMRIVVYGVCHTDCGIKMRCTDCGIQIIVYEVWYTECVIRIMVYGVCHTECDKQSVILKWVVRKCDTQIVVCILLYSEYDMSDNGEGCTE